MRAGALPGRLRTLRDDAWRHRNKVLKASSVQGDIGDKLPVDYGTDRCIGGVEREAAGIDDDGFGDRTNLQADEQSPGIADVQKQAGELRSGKACTLNAQRVRTGYYARQQEATLPIGRRVVLRSCLDVDQFQLGIGDAGLGRVLHNAQDGRCRHLCTAG